MFAYPLHTVSDNSVKRSHKSNKTCSTLSKFVLFLNSFTITLLAARHFKQTFVWKREKCICKLKAECWCIECYIENQMSLYWMMTSVCKVGTLFWLDTNSLVFVSGILSDSCTVPYVNINNIPESFRNKLTSIADGTSSSNIFGSVELKTSNNLRNGVEICFELKYCANSW